MEYHGAMNRYLVTALLLASLAPAAFADAEGLPPPNWTRAAALAAQDPQAVSATLEHLYQLTRDGRSDDLLAEVHRIAVDPAYPAADRDRVLQQLAASLGDFPPGQVDVRILERLSNTRARVRVPHQEHPGVGVPLYNIRAAASGSLAHWKRAADQTATAEAITPFALISELSRPGSGHLERIRKARMALSADEIAETLLAVPGLPDATTASLLLAELAPTVIDRPAVVTLLFALLDDPLLGGAAALALADSDDPATLDRLAELADQEPGLASRRAALALQSRLRAEAPR